MTDDWIKSRRPYEYHVEGRYSLSNEELFCDRAASFGSPSHPFCLKNPATKKVTVHHGEYAKPEYLVLCNECAEGLKKDVRKHGYTMKVETISPTTKLDILQYALEREVWRGF
jgi:hypothetical protein